MATILKTRYTSPGFWNVGLNLFKEAEKLVSDASERKHLQGCISQAQDHLGEVQNQTEDSRSQGRSNGGTRSSHLSQVVLFVFVYIYPMLYKHIGPC